MSAKYRVASFPFRFTASSSRSFSLTFSFFSSRFALRQFIDIRKQFFTYISCSLLLLSNYSRKRWLYIAAHLGEEIFESARLLAVRWLRVIYLLIKAKVASTNVRLRCSVTASRHIRQCTAHYFSWIYKRMASNSQDNLIFMNGQRVRANRLTARLFLSNVSDRLRYTSRWIKDRHYLHVIVIIYIGQPIRVARDAENQLHSSNRLQVLLLGPAHLGNVVVFS